MAKRFAAGSFIVYCCCAPCWVREVLQQFGPCKQCEELCSPQQTLEDILRIYCTITNAMTHDPTNVIKEWDRAEVVKLMHIQLVYRIYQEPISWSEQLPYWAYATVFYGPVNFYTHFRALFPTKTESPLYL